jgi:hypothetical protein
MYPFVAQEMFMNSTFKFLCWSILIAITSGSWVRADTIYANLLARSSQFDAGDSKSYLGTSATMAPLITADNDSQARIASAGASLQSVFAATEANQSGASRPDSFASLRGFEVSFSNDSVLQSALAANGGAALEFYARFQAEFAMVNTSNPRGGVSGAFNQTVTQSSASIEETGLSYFNTSATVYGQNGPFLNYTNTYSGFVEESWVNNGRFVVDIPFSIDAGHLSAKFNINTSSMSLSLELPTSSSATVYLPDHGDIFLASGALASNQGLNYSISATPVPLPASGWMFGSILFSVYWPRRRKSLTVHP